MAMPLDFPYNRVVVRVIFILNISTGIKTVSQNSKTLKDHYTTDHHCLNNNNKKLAFGQRMLLV